MQTSSEQPSGRVIPPGYPSDPNRALTYDPHGNPPASAQAMRDTPAGLASGWVSAGFGLLQVLAPRTVARTIGMPYPPWLIRAVGARDLTLGLGLLAQPDSSGWRQARIANDVLDMVGLIGVAALLPKTNRRRLAVFALFASAIVALDARTAAGRTPAQEMDAAAAR
jgi:hypothetical protein